MKMKNYKIAILLLMATAYCANDTGQAGSTTAPATTGVSQETTQPANQVNTDNTDTVDNTQNNQTDPAMIVLTERFFYLDTITAAGHLLVSYQGDTLKLELTTDSPWSVSSLSIWADSDLATIPLNKKYKATAGQFPWQYLATTGELSLLYEIALQDILTPDPVTGFCGANVYMATQLTVDETLGDGSVATYPVWSADYSFTPDHYTTDQFEQGWFQFTITCP